MQSKSKEELTSKRASEKKKENGFKSHDVSTKLTKARNNLEKMKATSSLSLKDQ